MRLTRARVQNYRSIKDSGWFEIERDKSILVGPNEAGKTALLKALEHIKAGPVVKALDPLRDYPRSEYHKIQAGEVAISSITVAEAEYELDDEDRLAIRAVAPAYEQCRYGRDVTMDNEIHHHLLDAPAVPTIGSTKDGLRRLAVQADVRVPSPAEGTTPPDKPSTQLNSILSSLTDNQQIRGDSAAKLKNWLDTVAAPYLDRNDTEQQQELRTLREQVNSAEAHDQVLSTLHGRCPVMVYFSTYTRVTPTLHLGHLADMLDRGDIEQTDTYNFGNSCLLKLLNFSARELSNLGRAPEPAVGDEAAWQQYRDQLDARGYRLNAASLNLTSQIKAVWAPSSDDNDYNISITADQQYLKVSVVDSTGAQVEIDQRSEGFQWLVSFFIVFFAQTSGALQTSILLLDEPGLSLHGLKQREFRNTLSRLAEANQLMFTTHSPFLVGPDELQLVRVVEMVDRQKGTKVHTEVVADDPASLLPLQEALG
jgi:hypothetical protein